MYSIPGKRKRKGRAKHDNMLQNTAATMKTSLG
jgi:hypothetical protein